ncbi:MAG: ABC transporter substrate-binding protein/permease [Gemmataceae bacterium]|nr:ABC transporter substrate-binding protein/permease [Gemmataceae bacterium]MDW8244401.1 ABC transporter substrate-binding protein/permease [Thermogemmata sp.]
MTLCIAIVAPVAGQEPAPATEVLRFGTDPTGGAPYIFKIDPAGPYVGFEVELASYLAHKLGRRAVPVEGEWSTLPELLDKPRHGEKGIDIVLNGYEQRDDLLQHYAATVPYYVYRLQLVAHAEDDSIQQWSDLRAGKRIGVLEGSVAFDYCQRRYPGQVLPNKDVAIMFEEVKRRGRVDATVQDNPACAWFVFQEPVYRGHLKIVGEGRQPGFYVIYLRKDDLQLKRQLDDAIRDGFRDGTLQRLYSKYGLWNADQQWLAWSLTGQFPPEDDAPIETLSSSGGGSVIPLIPKLLQAAGMTVFLSVASFPLAMLLGLLIALGRVYGPSWLAAPLTLYVEVIRGTPLMLQLYFLFFMMPKIHPVLALDPLYTGILGLALNYAAYEAENYRAGLLAIPRGQMEAALALGMTPLTALRTVIVPQAMRIVIPPVTNDFIALFKDTSVCSVILITELTRRYNELYNFNRDLVVELAILTAALYLLMSYPLALVARTLERRWGTPHVPR